jgi:hypothetical protein
MGVALPTRSGVRRSPGRILAQAGRRPRKSKALDIDEVRAMLDRCDLAQPMGLSDRVLITPEVNLMGRHN